MQRHPEYEIETEQLNTVIHQLEQRINSAHTEFDAIRGRPIKDDTDLIRFEVKKQAQSRVRQNYEPHLDSPYFGRVIYQENGSEEKENFYIGYFHEELADRTVILDWRSTFAGAVWDASSRQFVQYRHNNKIFTGRLFLKRSLKIESRAIVSISDLIDQRPRDRKEIAEDEFIDTVIDPDDYLRLIIQGKAGRGLEDIVASIQYEQQKIIREDTDQILIIQGSAGSGKTTIALHRISVLAFQQSDYQQALNPNRILIIGSSEGFLEFVASQSILTKLEINQVKRSTFPNWSMTISRIPLTVEDKTFYEIVDKNMHVHTRRTIYKCSRLKGDLRLTTVLERFISAYQVQLRIDDITCKPTGFGNLELTYRLSPEDADQILLDTGHLPYNRRLLAIQARIVRQFQQQHKNFYLERVKVFENLIEFPPDGISLDRIQIWRNLIKPYSTFQVEDEQQLIQVQKQSIQNTTEEAIKAINREIEQKVRDHFKANIPELNALNLYVEFINNPDSIADVAGDLFTEDEILDLSYIAIHDTSDLRIEDLPPITFLHILLNGKQLDSQGFDHIVVDEAQDLSPFQFWLLRDFVPSASMTILGDIAQSIHSYRGIRSWDELDDVFEKDKRKRIDLTKTYRSTYEIVSFANAVLDGEILGNRYTLAEPFERYNNEIVLQQASNEKHHLELILAKLKEYKERYETVAIVVRDGEQADWLVETISKANLRISSITSPSQIYNGGIVVILAHLVKGMEFQACIIADANEENYNDTLFDGRLLYVGITRALHDLAVFWSGEISPHLAHLAE